MGRPRKTLAQIREDLSRLVCTQLGQFKSVQAIKDAVWKRYQVTVSDQMVANLQRHPQWMPMIQLARLQYLSNLLEVPIANKKVRLERLEELYQTALTQEDLPLARSQLVAAREEMEESKTMTSHTNIFINQQIATMDAASLERRRMEIVERLRTLGGFHGLNTPRQALPDPEAGAGTQASAS